MPARWSVQTSGMSSAVTLGSANGSRNHTRPVAASVEELLAGATCREPMPTPAAGLSNARFERVTIDGAPFVLKHLHVDGDWVARATGDVTCRPVTAWRSGLLDQLPAGLDHTITGCAAGLGRHGWGAAGAHPTGRSRPGAAMTRPRRSGLSSDPPDNEWMIHPDHDHTTLCPARLAGCGDRVAIYPLPDPPMLGSIIGLDKAEVINQRDRWDSLEQVEWETMRWVAWFNHDRIDETLGDIPPAVLETDHYRQTTPTELAGVT